MKQCPKCQANISDTAKFCVKCGCNIKKYEEEQAQVYFCPECGTKFSGGVFCPECGFDISSELKGQDATAENDAFGDGWLSDLESSSNANVAAMEAQKSKEQTEKALSAFEFEAHSDGTYTIIALKDKHALSITVPEGVVAIADHAFEGCEAFSISLPEGLLKIGNAAFKSSVDLSSINFPKSLISIGDEAFADCETLDIAIPESVRKVGEDVILNTVQDKKRKAELAKYQVGNIVSFGSYKHLTYPHGSYEKEVRDISWRVLKQEDDKALLFSEEALDIVPLNEKKTNTNWEKCTLRVWLNDKFINTAFNTSEREIILTTEVDNSYQHSHQQNLNNTFDKIFILSKKEVKDNIVCNRVEHSIGRNWWVRTAYAYHNDEFYWFSGEGEEAYYLTERESYPDYTDVNNCYGCVRPAMWIKI